MTDNDGRPRPQFGEYATPEEQAASIQVPQDTSHDEPVPVPLSREGAHTEHDRNEQDRPDHGRTGRPGVRGWQGGSERPARSADRIATVALLAVGLINVIVTVPGMFDLPATINATFTSLGIGKFEPTPLAYGIGIALAIFYIVAWLVAAGLSVRSLRTDRTTFWIPLVAGVVVNVVAMVCFLVLFFADASFMEYVSTRA